MDFCSVDMMSGAFVLSHISLLLASRVAPVQGPYFGFHGHMVCTYILYRSLPIAAPLGFVSITLKLRNIKLTTS